MSDKTAVKIMITVQWDDDKYSPTHVASDAVTIIGIVDVACICERKVTEVVTQDALQTAIGKWIEKEIVDGTIP